MRILREPKRQIQGWEEHNFLQNQKVRAVFDDRGSKLKIAMGFSANVIARDNFRHVRSRLFVCVDKRVHYLFWKLVSSVTKTKFGKPPPLAQVRAFGVPQAPSIWPEVLVLLLNMFKWRREM